MEAHLVLGNAGTLFRTKKRYTSGLDVDLLEYEMEWKFTALIHSFFHCAGLRVESYGTGSQVR